MKLGLQNYVVIMPIKTGVSNLTPTTSEADSKSVGGNTAATYRDSQERRPVF
jgi:hypothetical protein